MGCGYSRISQSVSYAVLRKSVIGAVIPEDDFAAFYSLCKTDIHTITSQVFINQGQLFFVVVAGEVVVHLTPSDSRPRIGITHKPGEVIHFFHGTEAANSDGTISSGGLKLSLSFTTLTTPAIIIGVDRSSVEDFARSRPHLTKLKTLLSLNLANFLTGPNSAHFRALTYKQLNILGPLLKLRLGVEEERIKFTGREFTLTSPLNCSNSQKPASAGSVSTNRNSVLKSIQSPNPSNGRLRQQESEAMNNHLKSPLRIKQVYSPTYVVLHGLLETVESQIREEPVESSLKAKPKAKIASAILSTLRTPTSSDSKYRKVHTTADEESANSQLPFVTIPKSPKNNLEISSRSSEKAGGKLLTPNSSMSPRHKSHPAGTIIGLEHFLAGKIVEGLAPVRVVGDLAILAHMDLEMLKILTSVDRRLQRVLSRNFIMNLLDSFRDQVPMISDMDEKAYTMLCSTIQLKSFAAGETIYKQGDNSKFAYIIIHGSVLQSTEWACAVNFPHFTSSSTLNKSASYSPHNGGGTSAAAIAAASSRGSAVNPEIAAAAAAAALSVGVGGVAAANANASAGGSHSGSAGASAVPSPLNAGGGAAAGMAEEPPPSSMITDTKVMGVSGLFGEVALVTEVPYLSSTTALEPTLLVAISRAAFNEIYNNNKATLAEIRIRMVGHEIGLQAILDHPVGSNMFREFVEENRAAENLQFYTSADRFDDMCARLKKHMMTLRTTGSMKNHGSGVLSGRIGGFDDGHSILLKTESLGGEGNTITFSPRAANAKVLETITEMQSIASEKTHLDATSEKRSVLTTLLEDDATLSQKQKSSSNNNNSKGPLGRVVSNSLMEEDNSMNDSPSVATVTGVAGIASPLSLMREGSGVSARGGGSNSYTSLSAKTSDVEEVVGMSPQPGKEAPSSAVGQSTTPPPPQPQLSPHQNINGVRLAPLIVDPHSNTHSPDFDDVLLDNQDTYLAQGCNSNPNSLRIGSTSNANSVHRPAAQDDKHAILISGTASADFSTPNESPVRGEESTKMMKMKYLKIEKTTTELQEVARTIMERYINEGSPCEINIPSAMRMNTQQIFEEWVNSHVALHEATGGAAGGGMVVPTLTNAPSFTSVGMSGKTNRDMDSMSTSKIKRHMNTPFFQLDFCDMFQEPKQEILKLLKADLFVRWKRTKEFQTFISSMKPYEDISMHSNHSKSSRGGSQAGSNRKSANNNNSGGGVSRESSFNKGLRALSVAR